MIPLRITVEFERLFRKHNISDEAQYELMKLVDEAVEEGCRDDDDGDDE